MQEDTQDCEAPLSFLLPKKLPPAITGFLAPRPDGFVQMKVTEKTLSLLPRHYATCMRACRCPLPLHIVAAMYETFTRWSWENTDRCAAVPDVDAATYAAARRTARGTSDRAVFRDLAARVIAPVSLGRGPLENVFDDGIVRTTSVTVGHKRLQCLKFIAVDWETSNIFIGPCCDIDDVLAELLVLFAPVLAGIVLSKKPSGDGEGAEEAEYTAYEHYQRLVELFRLWRGSNQRYDRQPLVTYASRWWRPSGEISHSDLSSMLAKKPGAEG